MNTQGYPGLPLAVCSGMLAGLETAVAFLIIALTMTRVLVDDDAR